MFTSARYRHACTETGPGHSVLLSGRSPRSSGIVGNTWYDRTLKQRVNVVDDPTVRVLGGRGAVRPRRRPATRFTVGDMLKARSAALEGRGRVVQGPRGDPDEQAAAPTAPTGTRGSGGRFVTSSWYTDAAPGWLERWNARGLPASYAPRASGNGCCRTRPRYVKYAGPDDVKGEWDGKDTVFPHRIRGETARGRLLRRPAADAVRRRDPARFRA